MVTQNWIHVTRNSPCPICGKPDWCSISADGSVCICMRNSMGSLKPTRNGGWVHRLRDQWRPALRKLIFTKPKKYRKDLPELMEYYRLLAFKKPGRIEALAQDLNLPLATLHWLGIGWSENRQAYAFPMKNGAGRIIGIHLRKRSGRKLCIPGSRLGLFIPNGLKKSGRIFLPEGVTDSAALLSVGYAAVGRPSCNSGVDHVVEFLGRQGTREAIIVADRDWPGQRGAEALSDTLVDLVPAVKVITPPQPFKDVREWISSCETTKGGSN